MALLPRADALAWDHNAHYHRLVLRRLPQGCQRVLDAGCGAGALAVRLAHHVPQVDAVDRDAGMLARARQVAPPGVEVRQADLVADPLPAGRYDAVVSLSVLHHLPLDVVLPRLAAALRPGGRLVAVALPRVELPRDLPVELAAAGAQAAVALVLAAARCAGAPVPVKDDAGMPVVAPTLTLRQVREQAQALLPGARVRRLLFWRYLLEWDRPGPAAAPRGPDAWTGGGRVGRAVLRPLRRRCWSPDSDVGRQVRRSTVPDTTQDADGTGFVLRPVHHVQLAIPRGGEPQCRAFWGGVLGMRELDKPPALVARGGCWFRGGDLEVHLGVEEPFAQARKAHPGLLVDGLPALARRLERAGSPVAWDADFPGHDRFYSADPFGNRLEFLQARR